MKILPMVIVAAFTLAGCQTKPLCPSATEIAEQRRQCELMQKQLQEAPKDKMLQSRGALEEKYAAECEQLLYYRENHSDPESCAIDPSGTK